MTNDFPFFEINEHLISMERLEGEVIIVSFDNGKYYSTEYSGADILWLVKHKVNPKSWESLLSAKYGFQDFPKNGIVSFLNKCVEEKILAETSVSMDNEASRPDDFIVSGWNCPKLLAFSDLQDLLMVDPIHDSSLEGWPRLKQADE
jgi:hypothetical protein